jgi:uncharacterized protein (TIGR02118 family)
MAKIIFILQRRTDLTRQQCQEYWRGETHRGVVSRIPGLRKWVQNHVVGGPGEAACDGVGEMWFDSDQAMNAALNSAEMGAAVEDAKNFLDMQKTSVFVVSEQTMIG